VNNGLLISSHKLAPKVREISLQLIGSANQSTI